MPLYKDPKNAVKMPGLYDVTHTGLSKWDKLKEILELFACSPTRSTSPFGVIHLYQDQSGHLEDLSGRTLCSWITLNQMLKELREVAEKKPSASASPICINCGMPIGGNVLSYSYANGDMVHESWRDCIRLLKQSLREFIREREAEEREDAND